MNTYFYKILQESRIVLLGTLIFVSSYVVKAQKAESISNDLDRFLKAIMEVKDPDMNNFSVVLTNITTQKTGLIINTLKKENYYYFYISDKDSVFYPLILKKADAYGLIPDIRARTIAHIIYKAILDTRFLGDSLKRSLINKEIQLVGSIIPTIYGNIRFFNSSFFDKKARFRIKEILTDDKLSEKQVQMLRQFYSFSNRTISDTIKNKQLGVSYNHYKEQGSLSITAWLDSINNHFINKKLASYSLIEIGLIRLIGNALLYEFAPQLEKLLYKPKYFFMKDEIEQTLARLQYEDFETKFLDQIKKGITSAETNKKIDESILKKKLLYLSTQKSLCLYAQFLKTNEMEYCEDGLPRLGEVNAGYKILVILNCLIKNFPAKKYFDKEDYRVAELEKKDPNFSKYPTICDYAKILPKDVLETTLQWMIQNEGKYKIITRNYELL